MTVLTLNGTQVFPDGKQQIKLVRENPYFTQSESYTLDVTLPMDILENRNFFQNIQRMEKSKQTSLMSCRLVVDNKPLLQGSAKVTQVTQQDVKVQLVGGRSEINFLSLDDKTYIDEMEMGGATHTYIPGEGRGGTWEANELPVRYVSPVVYNETGEYMRNDAPNPHLNDVLKQALLESGYTVEYNARDVVPWNCIYIASAKRTLLLSHALPHWTVREFVDEYCKLFNCTLVVNQFAKTVRIVSNSEYFSNTRHTQIEPVDEYSVELNDDAEANALAADNLSFDISGSSEHDYDVIADNIRESAPTIEYSSKNEAEAAYNNMSSEDRLKYIFNTPIGRWIGWKHDYSDVSGGEQTLFTQIDIFGPLIRDTGRDSETSLKICPVAISEDNTYPFVGRGAQWTCRMPSLENPTGDESGTRGRGSDEETNTIQEYIEGEADIEKSEKEDRMQVFFVDDILQDSICVAVDNPRLHVNVGDIMAMLMPFTDSSYKKNHGGNAHRRWSLSLNPTGDEHYLGELHQNNYTFNMKAKYCVKFLADEMPDPTQVFIIRNKRFACEKIEAQIDDQGLQKLMTGYFYEMQEAPLYEESGSDESESE